MRRTILALALLYLCVPQISEAQTDTGGEFSGLVFSDYYWIAAHHDADLEGQHGFRIRRIYFTYDHQLDPSWSARLRLEMDQPGDFQTVTKMRPVVKDAWVRYAPAQHKITFGITSTPTWGLIGDIWGYRSIEKTAVDLQDWGSSRDFGISAEGPVPGSSRFRYHVMVGNGSSNKSEADRGKKVMGGLSFAPIDQVVLQGYLDYEAMAGSRSRQTSQLFAGFRTGAVRGGLQWAHQVREGPGGTSQLDLASTFATFELSSTTTAITRVDRMFDPNPTGESIDYLPFSDAAASTFFLAGIDYNPVSHFHLIPNVELIQYDEPAVGPTPETDVVPRLTIYYDF